ncbi:putative cytochrome P450 [Smittium culicis]|uniref:Putative cytochrome P450 n=1 Tax=Smittium culicis TaxID=133412 RepID=A0A1R1YN64_9FUNG|nr:putative cytochrome P450 [Smittium culicis]
MTFRSFSLISSSRLANAIVDISIRPEVYNRLLNEQKRIIEKLGDSINPKILDKMKYLDSVILESLRLSSPASHIHRKVNQDIVVSNGCLIKNGSVVSLSSFSNFRNKTIFGDDANEFVPDRHLSDNRKLKVK